MLEFLWPILLLGLCVVMAIRAIRLQKVNIPLPLFDDIWVVKREDLPFFYWLGLSLWSLGGLGCLVWIFILI